MNVMVSLHSSDVSWAGIGPMTGTVSSKSWNAWLMGHPRRLALGMWMSWTM